MRITYVPESFPQVSETFIINEIRWLKLKGHDVVVVPRLAGDEDAWSHDRARAIKSSLVVDADRRKTAWQAVPACLRRSGAVKPGRRPRAIWRHLRHSVGLAEHVHRIGCHATDLIVCHFGFDNAISASLAGERLGVPVVQWLHGSELYTQPHRSRVWYTGRSDLSVTNSQYSLDLIRKLGISQRVFVAGLGVDAHTFHTNSLRGKTSQPTVVCVGRLGHNKNQARLLRVFARVIKRVPDAKLRLIGDGPDMADLREQARSLDLTNCVDFCGRLYRQDIADNLRESWAFALLSDKEALGVVFMEAMACGLPAIGPNLGGVPEVIEHGVSGYLVDIQDAEAEVIAAEHLVDVLTDTTLRESLSQAAADRASRDFCEEKACQRFLDAIEDVVRKSKHKH